MMVGTVSVTVALLTLAVEGEFPDCSWTGISSTRSMDDSWASLLLRLMTMGFAEILHSLTGTRQLGPMSATKLLTFRQDEV